jgi:hypothetical protein
MRLCGELKWCVVYGADRNRYQTYSFIFKMEKVFAYAMRELADNGVRVIVIPTGQ